MGMGMREDWTTAEIAKEAGLSQAYVRQDIRAGRLNAYKRAKTWFIQVAEARRWLARHPRQKQKRGVTVSKK